MNVSDISFPHLGIYLRDVPRSFTILGFEIALYGLIIGCGMLAAVYLSARMAERTGANPDDIWNVSIWLLVFSVIGARIYYVIFSWEAYKDRPLEILNIRGGGLAIYGGVIAGFATVAIYTRVKRLPFLKIADAIMHGLLLGQIVGRWGNFFNREAFGDYTDGLFAMRLPVAAVRSQDITETMRAHMAQGTDFIQVHPTFLYESTWNLCLLVILFMVGRYWKNRFDGALILMYLGGYGIGRFLIEGLRTDQLLFPGTRIAVSQMLGLALFLFASVAAFLKLSRDRRTQAADNKEEKEEAAKEERRGEDT